MPNAWTGEIVGKMHVLGINNIELASRLGYTAEYVSMVLNGKKSPKNAEKIYKLALKQIEDERKGQ